MTASVIITCYNYGHYLSEAIESVLHQSYNQQEIEIIVVNDGSTDNTIEIARQYPITLFNQSNQGVVVARNNGISHSKGKFILTLDADDKIHPAFLETTVPILESFPSIGVVYTHRCHFGLLNTIKYAEKFDLERLKKKSILNYCSLYRKQIWSECGGYNPKMKDGYEDWDFWLSIAKRKWEFHLVNKILFYYRKHGYNMSNVAKENHNKLMEIIQSNHPELFE